MIDYMTIAKDVGQRIKVDMLLKNPSDIEHLKRVMQELEKSPAGNSTLWVDYEGEKYLLGVAYLPEVGWYDLTLMEKHSLNLFKDLIFSPVLFGSALLFALLAVGWALRRWILDPIAALRASTEKIRQGDFAVDIPVTGSGEIADLSRSFERMAKTVTESTRGLEVKVRQRTEELHRLTETDPLTGLFNRRGMMERFENEIARQSRQGGELGLLLLDLDHFKQINDIYGHAAGDLALCEATKVIQSTKRGYDHAARWGGEEFLMLLPDCAKNDLLTIAERIREGIGTLKIQAGEQTFTFTVSIGAHHPNMPQTLDTMLQKVDSALYAAKDSGRNCVRLSQ
jgi:diguanylate cyclase (GGDEF)-like protein